MASVFKGFTEAISEIGSATSDAALYHSKHLHGDEYASTVTKHYVDGYGGNLFITHIITIIIIIIIITIIITIIIIIIVLIIINVRNWIRYL